MTDGLATQRLGAAAIPAIDAAYRETLVRDTEVDLTHKKQTGDTGRFARVKLRLEPSS